MADIATISLKVNTSEVERGSNELDNFRLLLLVQLKVLMVLVIAARMYQR